VHRNLGTFVCHQFTPTRTDLSRCLQARGYRHGLRARYGHLQNTRNFTDFNRVISINETDIFRPLFDQIEKLSGKKYGSTLPAVGLPLRPDRRR